MASPKISLPLERGFLLKPATFLLLAVLLALAACAGEDSGTPSPADCPEGLEPAVEYRLYFGLTDGGGSEISQEEWNWFLDRVITPRFPNGFTVLEAHGQWQPPTGDLVRESSRVLVVGVPNSWEGDAWGLISEITGEWEKLFDGVVYHLVQDSCAGISQAGRTWSDV